MPRGDGTGPMGAGPMTGRGAGYCVGLGMPGYANGGWGRGMRGRGFGRGRGGRQGFFGLGRGPRGWWGSPSPVASDPAQERNMLEQERSMLKNEMEQVQQRLDELGE